MGTTGYGKPVLADVESEEPKQGRRSTPGRGRALHRRQKSLDYLEEDFPAYPSGRAACEAVTGEQNQQSRLGLADVLAPTRVELRDAAHRGESTIAFTVADLKM